MSGNIIQRKRSVVGRKLSFSTSNQNDQSRIAVEQGEVQLSSETQNLSTPSSEPESQTRGSEESATTKKKGRGITVAAATWARSEPYNDLRYNEYGQAIDARAKDFSTFIGTLSRKSEIAPLYVTDWRYVNLRAKEKKFKLCQERFGMDGSNKSRRYVLEKVAACWRKSKNKLKKKAFKAGATVAQQAVVRPQYIPEEHWTTLCHYWQTPEAQSISKINKDNREKNDMPHTGGSKTLARWREELRSPNGTPPSRSELFCHLRIKRGTQNPISDEARKKIK